MASQSVSRSVMFLKDERSSSSLAMFLSFSAKLPRPSLLEKPPKRSARNRSLYEPVS